MRCTRSSERSRDSGGVNNPHLLREHATFLPVPSLSRSLHQKQTGARAQSPFRAWERPSPGSRQQKKYSKSWPCMEESLEVTHLQDLALPKWKKKTNLKLLFCWWRLMSNDFPRREPPSKDQFLELKLFPAAAFLWTTVEHFQLMRHRGAQPPADTTPEHICWFPSCSSRDQIYSS